MKERYEGVDRPKEERERDAQKSKMDACIRDTPSHARYVYMIETLTIE